MSLDTLVDKLGEVKSSSMSMKDAVSVLKNCPTFRQLVVATSCMTAEQLSEVFKAIAILKAGIVKNAFSEGEGEDMSAFSEWPQLVDFIDTLMTGLSNA